MSPEADIAAQSTISVDSIARHYDHVIFDCDGVLFDSNRIKESNIRAAVAAVVGEGDEVERFVTFFTGNNGVPRETKIRAHFPTEAVSSAILQRYNALNEASVTTLTMLPDAARVLRALAAADVQLHVLSGGDEEEVRRLLAFNEVSNLIENICGGPTTKAEHLERLGLEGRLCFFGDSALDYEVARKYGFDFVFLYRYTQFVGWREFFCDGDVRVETDFSFIES